MTYYQLMRRHVLLYAGLLLAGANSIHAQRAWTAIPPDLRASLQQRLDAFTHAEEAGQWDKVATMLGRYRRGGSGDLLFTPEHKQCFVSQLKTMPMTAFTFAFKEVAASTEIISKPIGERWWYLNGEGVFRASDGELKNRTTVVAYRDNGQWYFTPQNYDRYLESTHATNVDANVDLRDEVNVVNITKCPLEIADVHVHADEKSPSEHHLTFILRNKSSRRVKGFFLGLYQTGGSVQYGAGAVIEPGGTRADKLTYSSYRYFCEGVPKRRFVVDSVRFDDGSEWAPNTRK
jgi:hypothetical protein